MTAVIIELNVISTFLNVFKYLTVVFQKQSLALSRRFLIIKAFELKTMFLYVLLVCTQVPLFPVSVACNSDLSDVLVYWWRPQRHRCGCGQ